MKKKLLVKLLLIKNMIFQVLEHRSTGVGNEEERWRDIKAEGNMDTTYLFRTQQQRQKSSILLK